MVMRSKALMRERKAGAESNGRNSLIEIQTGRLAVAKEQTLVYLTCLVEYISYS